VGRRPAGLVGEPRVTSATVAGAYLAEYARLGGGDACRVHSA
jgi:hypothetical protein